MSPVLHRDLRITEDVSVRLVLSDDRVNNTAKVTLMYTDGIISKIIGDYTYPSAIRLRDTTPAVIDFTIPVSSPVTVPAGYKLVLMFTNLGTGNTYFRVYHNSDAAQNSNISMSVTDYVGVDWIKSYDVFGVTSTAYVEGESLRISAQVSDPFGAYAVANARIAIYNPSGVTQVAGTTLMTYDNTDSAAVPGYKQYYYDYTIPASPETGMWSAVVEGEEDNGAVSSRVYNFYVRAPDHIQLNPVFSVIPAGNEVALKSQVVDIDGNSLNSAQLITVTVNGSAIFSAAPAGWTGEGTNTIYGNTNAAGYAEFSVYNAAAENVTITPACALAGSPANNINSYIWFTPPHHASVSVTDGIAAAGVAGTGETVRVWIEDIYGNTVSSSQFVTVTLDNGGYFSSVPAGWSGAGTGTAFGFTNAAGYEDLIVKNNTAATVIVDTDSSGWGFTAFDESASVKFVAPGVDHVEITDAGSGTLTASNERVLNIKVMDADGIVVPIAQEVVIYTSGAATFTASTLTGVTGLGTNTVTGTTASTGLASITVINYTAQPVTITPDSTLSGSISVPDRDVSAVITWGPGTADHVVASAAADYSEIGGTVLINLQVVDMYNNNVPGARPISVTTTGAAIFTSTSLSSAAGINTAALSGTTDSLGAGYVYLYNETAQTNSVTPNSALAGSVAVPDRDIGTKVIFTSNMPTPTVTATATITATITRTSTLLITTTATPTATLTITQTTTQTTTPTVTGTNTQTVTETITQTTTPTVTGTNTQTVTQTITQTTTPTVTGTNTQTVTQTTTPTVTETNTQTVTQTITQTTTPTVTGTNT
ncbi:MAG TPA: hypothetical protein PKZ78_09795, partial [Candidatus Goldiibacteriota bacterium]|nr:hypothetical protein [Candidatus Goldiibacteriota bacterium]